MPFLPLLHPAQQLARPDFGAQSKLPRATLISDNRLPRLASLGGKITVARCDRDFRSPPVGSQPATPRAVPKSPLATSGLCANCHSCLAVPSSPSYRATFRPRAFVAWWQANVTPGRDGQLELSGRRNSGKVVAEQKQPSLPAADATAQTGVSKLPWLDREFGWSRQTADRFIDVYEARTKLCPIWAIWHCPSAASTCSPRPPPPTKPAKPSSSAPSLRRSPTAPRAPRRAMRSWAGYRPAFRQIAIDARRKCGRGT